MKRIAERKVKSDEFHAQTTPVSERQLSLGGRIGYATGIYGVFLAWMTVALYLLYFYTDVLGLSPARAGLVFFLASLWDGITDPLMGWLIERTRSRWGKYRPYLLLAAVPFAASFAALFITPDLEGDSLFWWALILHIVFRTCYTVVYIPYTSLIARLSTDADERASIAGVKSVFISLASLSVSFLGLPAVSYFGGPDEALGFLRVALICACLGVAALWLCFAFTRERRTDADAAPPAIRPAEMLQALKSNHAFLLIFVGVILFTGCYTILNKSIVYVFKYDLGDRDAARWALSAIAVAGILSPAIWVPITHWTSKKTVWIIGCLLASVSLLTIYVAGIQELVPLVTLIFIGGTGIHAFLMTFFAMVADTADYGEWKTGKRLEAPLFGLVSLANKTSLAVGTWSLSVLLEAVGFEANVEQSEATLTGLRQIMTLVPICGFVASALVIAAFPFNTREHARMVTELRERRAANSMSESGITPAA
ncbi:MAG: MFS transporter [Gammaproteobacteria bacterium]|nr:MFS transporter [Gammaproteobacteria bacterium]